MTALTAEARAAIEEGHLAHLVTINRLDGVGPWMERASA